MEVTIQLGTLQKKLQGNFQDFEQFTKAVQDLFQFKPIAFTYIDDDNDIITVTCTEDIKEFYDCNIPHILLIQQNILTEFQENSSNTPIKMEIASNTLPIQNLNKATSVQINQNDIALNTSQIDMKDSQTNTAQQQNKSNNTIQITKIDQTSETQVNQVQDNTTAVIYEDFILSNETQTDKVVTENQNIQTQLQSNMQIQTHYQVSMVESTQTQLMHSGSTQTQSLQLINNDIQTNLVQFSNQDQLVSDNTDIQSVEEEQKNIFFQQNKVIESHIEQTIKEQYQLFHQHESSCAECLMQIIGVKFICIECSVILCVKCQHQEHNSIRLQKTIKQIRKPSNPQVNPATRLSCIFIKDMIKIPLQATPGEKFH